MKYKLKHIDMGTVMYNVVYVVNGKDIEVIEYNKPIALAKYIKKQKENTTHKMGSVVLRKRN